MLAKRAYFGSVVVRGKIYVMGGRSALTQEPDYTKVFSHTHTQSHTHVHTLSHAVLPRKSLIAPKFSQKRAIFFLKWFVVVRGKI